MTHALAAGLAGGREALAVRAADGRDRHGMIFVNPFPAGVFPRLLTLCAVHHPALITCIEHVETPFKF